MDDYPRLSFICNLKILDPQKFSKTFSLKRKLDKKIDLNLSGSFNLLKKSINFEYIKIKIFM